MQGSLLHMRLLLTVAELWIKQMILFDLLIIRWTIQTTHTAYGKYIRHQGTPYMFTGIHSTLNIAQTVSKTLLPCMTALQLTRLLFIGGKCLNYLTCTRFDKSVDQNMYLAQTVFIKDIYGDIYIYNVVIILQYCVRVSYWWPCRVYCSYTRLSFVFTRLPFGASEMVNNIRRRIWLQKQTKTHVSRTPCHLDS